MPVDQVHLAYRAVQEALRLGMTVDAKLRAMFGTELVDTGERFNGGAPHFREK